MANCKKATPNLLVIPFNMKDVGGTDHNKKCRVVLSDKMCNINPCDRKQFECIKIRFSFAILYSSVFICFFSPPFISFFLYYNRSN